MTIPGRRATSARRTVTVAVALLTGQALLGAVLAVVTFGGSDRPTGSSAVAAPAVPSGRAVAPAHRASGPTHPVTVPRAGAAGSRAPGTGAHCHREGATDRTVAGQKVRCSRGSGGPPRWLPE